MKSKTCNSTTLAAIAAVIIGLMAPSNGSAQAPAQGPPPSTPNSHSLTVTSITNTVLQTIQAIVDEQNAALAVDPKTRAVISVEHVVYSPAMTSTTNIDKPNEFAALTPYIMTYKITGLKANVGGVWISYPFDRKLYQSIYVYSTCDGWYKGRGTLKHVARADAPGLDTDHSFVEEALSDLLVNRLPSYIDTQVKQRLANFSASVTTTTTSTACNTLGVNTKAMGFPYDTIQYDAFPNFPFPSVTPNITVTLLQVKRLPLHRTTGGVVYDPVEQPALDFWADFANLHFELPPMVENQVWTAPLKATVSTPVPPDSRQLVLIGNIVYNGGNSEDSSWVSFGKPSDFGNGVKTFQVMKRWIETSTMPGVKTVKRIGPGYEITVRISAPIPTSAPF